MLIAATIFTKHRQHVVERWAREGGLPPVEGTVVNNLLTSGPVETPPDLVLYGLKEHYRLPKEGKLTETCLGNPSLAGGMVVLDWESTQFVWQSTWGNVIYTPAGFCFADASLYVNDLEGCSVFRIGLDSQIGRPVARISHPYMNDLHGLERTSRGLLVACSGTDAIIEIDLQGRLLYEWWAADHGFTAGPARFQREAGRGHEHRDKFYHTRYQSTHVNTAVFQDHAERFMLALLFHQGQLVRIDRAKPQSQQDAQVILDGLARPHGLEQTHAGWMLCSSAASELIMLDGDLQVNKRIPMAAGWLQDCTMLSHGHVLVNDVDNHSLIELGGSDFSIIKQWVYPPDWRIDEIREVPRAYECAFRASSV